jgi:cbb3-type cytochrome oxidase subunit 1
MDSMHNWALKFIRWGMGLTILGLITGYFPLVHYLMDDAIPSCPSAPIHGHVILLGFVGMTMFGLAYGALPAWMGGATPPLGLIRAHFWLSVAGIIGVLINGEVVYEILRHVQPGFYYIEADGQTVRNLWFAIDGAFLTIYGLGCVIFARIVMTRTSYTRASQSAVDARVRV